MRGALAAVLLAGCAAAPSVIWTGRTADRRHTVEIQQGHGTQWVVVDGARRAAYQGIAAWSLATGDGARVAYAAKRGARWVVVDGGEGPPFDGIGELVVGPRGRLAYAAERGGRWDVVVDGRVPAAPRFTAILAHTLRFSANGARVVYAAQDASGAHVVVDGVPGPAYLGVGQLALSADGAHVAYAAREGTDAFVVADGARGPAYQNIAQLTAASGRVAYVGVDRLGQRAVVGGAAQLPATAIADLRVSADGAHAAYVAHDPDVDDRLICDGAEVAHLAPRTLRAHSLALTAGCALAYVVADGGGARVVRGTEPGPRYDEVGPLSLSADGAHLGYAARLGTAWRVVIDGTEHPGGRWAEAPVFSPDGARWAYLSRTPDRATVTVDGHAYPLEMALEGTVAFSRDGRAWAVLAGSLRHEQLYFIVNGTERVPLAASELYATAATIQDDLLGAPNVLGAWSAAEADRAAAR